VRSRVSLLDFDYTPAPGFDTRNVKGLVAPRAQARGPWEKHGRWQEDERVSKDLLERAVLRNV